MSWLDDVKYDAVGALRSSGHAAIEYWARKELLSNAVPDVKDVLWNLKIPASIVRKQNDDGSWTYPAKKESGGVNYTQLETYRQLGFLVEMFGFNRQHPSIQTAAEYLLSYQSAVGDIRGIYAKQYSPNYTAAILELLVKAGYQGDDRVRKVFEWLDSVRQDDGGWALPFRTRGRNLDVIYEGDERLEPDTTKPFSHFATGVVLRAYAAHPDYRHTEPAKEAAALLVERLLEKDVYPDRNRVDDWTRFSFPFWQTDLLSTLDTVGLVDPSLANHPKVLQAKQWFIDHQEANGLFTGHLLKDRYHDLQLWYTLAICRALQRFS